jgi:cytidine deaminase
MTDKELIREAFEAKKKSYSPYSGYSVGAALLCKNGKVYRGCNIESSTYTPTNCAERTAFFKAISEGDTEFEAIAVVGGKSAEDVSSYFYPCGVCRQVMVEFCDMDTFKIIVAKSEDDYVVNTLSELMPNMIRPEKY